ncbi:MAG: hypothetical protein JNJ45_07095 [Chthonomonas sp.]|nr:hypothetical protein [Chthonomonas sp.]
MNLRHKLIGVLVAAFALGASAVAQIPDLLTGLDAGGRAMGMGGSLYGTSADSFSALSNPAGLGYVSGRQVTLAFRNLPESATTAQNNFRNPDLSTDAGSGDIGLTHAGLVQRQGKGAIGLSYTKLGHINDSRVGLGDLTLDAGTSIRNYREKQRASIDMFTLAYGQAANATGYTYGFGLVFASTYVRNTQSYDLVSGGNANPTTPLDISGSGNGVGVVAGMQYVPKNSKMVYGVSVRTPIDLQGNAGTSQILDRIPGRLELSVAKRQENYRGEGNYLLYGASAGRTFGSNYGQLFQRKGQFFGGLGVEFNRVMGNARIPLRVGYQVIPNAGRGFKDRNSLTFGVGYRPFDQNYSVDLNFATSSGSFDRGIAITYRLK